MTHLGHEFLGLLALVQLHLSLQLLEKKTTLFILLPKTRSPFSSSPPAHLYKRLPLEVEVCLGGELESLRRGGQLAKHRELQVVLEHLLVVPVRLGVT